MVFSSLQFIFIFLPVFFIFYYLAPCNKKNLILLTGSLIFYFIGTIEHPEHFILFLTSILTDFLMGILMEKYQNHKKIFLAIGILFHLLCMTVFKYGIFLIDELGRLFPDFHFTAKLFLPIGISFYTFQGISYLADVYRKNITAEKSLHCFSIYISMFPQLIAGPIVTYRQVERELRKRKILLSHIVSGIVTFIFGLGLKVLLANPAGKLWNDVKAIGFESISTPLAWMAVLAFSIQIYFDFFGYSLMAVGLGKMLGFRLPHNFNFPYMSRSMTEFWRRWHITLGDWFKEYVYIPLGGNRKGVIITLRNLFLVWMLTGAWHGAGYNFLLWGAVLFFLIAVEKFWIGRFLDKIPALGHIYMIFIIPLTWSVFAIEDIKQLALFFSRLFPFFGQGVWSVFRYDYLKYFRLYWPFLLAGVLLSTKLPFRVLKRVKNPFLIGTVITGILIASIYCMYRGLDDPFLYFRF